MERFRALAEGLAEHLNPAVKPQVEQAAYLCKADLVSGMVGEFPEVQGIMGREYALLEGEHADVATPSPSTTCRPRPAVNCRHRTSAPSSPSADKLDTICGCFGVGLIPTGSRRPLCPAPLGHRHHQHHPRPRIPPVALPDWHRRIAGAAGRQTDPAGGRGKGRCAGVFPRPLHQPAGRSLPD